MTLFGNTISGSEILLSVKAAYYPYREDILPKKKKIAIMLFTPSRSSSEAWKTRMRASAISAEQKKRVFDYLGFETKKLGDFRW